MTGILFSKTLNTFYEDVFDFKKGANAIVHLKSNLELYGQVKFLDNTDKPEWIYLQNGIAYRDKCKYHNICTDDEVKGIAVPMKDVEYIEIT